ncbi:interleukin-17 receptor B isoform X2 [Electrophorus electricus]|nr:interleukin-17 receptor B isoform X2 [Electrophorus electricus]
MQTSPPVQLSYKCQYDPPFTSKQANYTGLEQLWFHFTITDIHTEPNGIYSVTAYNLPTPPINASGQKLKSKAVQAPGCDDEQMKNYSICLRQLNNELWNISAVREEDEVEVTFKSHSDSNYYEIRLLRGTNILNISKVVTGKKITTVKRKLKYSGPCENLEIWISPNFEHCEPVCDTVKCKVDCEEPNKHEMPVLIIVAGCVLAVPLVFICFWQFCRLCMGRGFSKPSLSSTSTGLMGVLVVYPPIDAMFQCAVMALADFLHSHKELEICIDMWQRGSLAEQGMLRWLTSQIDRADKVLVIFPPGCTDTGIGTNGCLNPNPVLANYTVPASAHELYSLALNLVMMDAYDPQLCSKFWVVHLGQAGDPPTVPVALQSCRAFSLPRDLEKLHYELACRHGEKWSSLGCRFQPIPCQEASRKFREALLNLDRSRMDCSKEEKVRLTDVENKL